MKKKMMSMLAVAMAAALIAGCSSGAQNAPAQASSGADAQASEEAPAEDAAQEESSENAAQGTGDYGEGFVFKHGFDLDYPPYSYINDAGEVGGFDVEMAQAVCAYYGWVYEPVPFNWDAKDAELNAGSCDCIWSGFTVNGREDDYLWSMSYSDNTQMIMVHVDSGIETLEDLNGKVVGVQTSTSAYDLLNDEEGQAQLKETFASLEVYETYTIAFNDLKAGAIDAIAIDVTSGNFLMSGDPDYRFLDEALGSEQYAIGFRMDDKELCDLVNAALEALVEDGTFDTIGQQYPDIYDYLSLGK
ncbi:MAG: transporter substrate-binding domain-containing protein [Lachnospiraceae bacterium]|nr:transporter substrate-binding domain-containing protein [Lachnospiraceae bacterium]